MAVNVRPSVMWVTGDIMAGTRAIEGPGKWYWIMDEQYDK
jgi:hypothetical protein